MIDNQHQPCPKPTTPFQLQSLVRAKGPTLTWFYHLLPGELSRKGQTWFTKPGRITVQ